MRGRLRTVLCAAAILSVAPAASVAQTLTIAVAAPVTSIDPHHHDVAANNAVASHLFDALTATDATGRVRPALARSWRALDATTWEFTLRDGVRFHHGTPLAADDVAFSLARAPSLPNSPSGFAQTLRMVAEVHVVDGTTLRLRTRAPHPLLPHDLARVMVLDRETHDGATNEAFGTGRVAFGTGPYRFVRYLPGEAIEFERNDDYWGEREPWVRATVRFAAGHGARIAALLAGEADLIDLVPAAELARLRADQRVSVSEAVSPRFAYLALDHGREAASPFVTGPDGETLERNPLRDPRVRRALSLAIDRAALAAQVMEGGAVPAGQFLPAGMPGHVADLAPPRFDADEARGLLAAAGFPAGLRITVHGPNDRFANDSRLLHTIGAMWTRIGVRTSVETMPWTTLAARAGRQEFSVLLASRTNGGEATATLRALVASFDRDRGSGAANRGRYANPVLDRLVERALATVDEAARDELVQEATRVAMADLAVIPLHHEKLAWAIRRGLRHEARVDGLTRAMDVRPAR